MKSQAICCLVCSQLDALLLVSCLCRACACMDVLSRDFNHVADDSETVTLSYPLGKEGLGECTGSFSHKQTEVAFQRRLVNYVLRQVNPYCCCKSSLAEYAGSCLDLVIIAEPLLPLNPFFFISCSLLNSGGPLVISPAPYMTCPIPLLPAIPRDQLPVLHLLSNSCSSIL